jgi:hypothetical protein
MADLAKIKRNVGRMVEQGAPESDIDQYISSEGVNLADVRAFKGGPSPEVQKEVQFRQNLGAGGMGLGLADNLSFGAFNPASAGIAAAGKTAVKALTGQPTDIVGDYRFERDVLDGLLKQGRDERGLGGTVGEIALSIPFIGGRAASGAAGAVAAPVASNLAQLGTLAKQGITYGGIYGVNSARGGVGEHIENTAVNALAGGVLAPALKLGIDGASKVAQLPGQVWRYLTSRSADDIANVQAREADFSRAGVRSFGPALAESPTQRSTAAGLAGSVFGAPLRREAQGTVDDATIAMQRAVREPIGYKPVNDVGADIQQTLDRNLAQHSIPADELARMSPQDRARITGGIVNDIAPDGTPQFRPGFSRESYPTEFSAAYDDVASRTPGYRSNPMGGPTAEGRAAKTETRAVVDGLADEARKRLHLKGDAFKDTGEVSDEMAAYLKSRFGDEIGYRISELSKTRPGHSATTPQGLKILRSEVRDAAQRAEKPPYPEVARTAEAAALRRLESALSKDMDAFSRRSGGPAETFTTATAKGEYVGTGQTKIGDNPPSDMTVYLRPEHADRLAGRPVPVDYQGALPPTRQLQVDGKAIVVKRNDKMDVDASTRVPFSTKPEVGLRPVQLWDDGSRVHYAAPITARGKTSGEQAADLMSVVDRSYKQHLNEVRRPLGELFGRNVTPIDAMNAIVKAAESGDLRLLRPYMRVMSEKSDPAKGAGALVAHITNNARSLEDFVKGYGSLSDDVKNVIFASEKGRQMRQALDLSLRVAERVAPFEKAIKTGGGVDFTNRANIYVGLSAMAHPVMAAVLASGAVVASKFMASPRYSAWLARVAQAKTRQAVNVEYGRLAAFLSRDTELPEAFKAQILEAAKTGKVPEQKERPPGMMKLGGPKEGDTEAAQQQPVDDGGMADLIAKAAQSKGIDLERAKPQEVLDAAWNASPSDRMGEAIEFIAKRHGLRLPWESDDENKRTRP